MTAGRDEREREGHAGDRPAMTDSYAEGLGGAGRALEDVEEGRGSARTEPPAPGGARRTPNGEEEDA